MMICDPSVSFSYDKNLTSVKKYFQIFFKKIRFNHDIFFQSHHQHNYVAIPRLIIEILIEQNVTKYPKGSSGLSSTVSPVIKWIFKVRSLESLRIICSWRTIICSMGGAAASDNFIRERNKKRSNACIVEEMFVFLIVFYFK